MCLFFNTAERYLKRYLMIPKTFLPNWYRYIYLTFHTRRFEIVVAFFVNFSHSLELYVWCPGSVPLVLLLFPSGATGCLGKCWRILTQNWFDTDVKFSLSKKRYFKLHMISISTVTLYLNFYVNSLNSMLRKIQTVVHYTTATELNSPANLRAKMLFRE